MLRTGLSLLKPIRSAVPLPCSSFLYTQSRNEDGFKWLWPAYHEMEMFAAAHSLGSRQTGGRFRYNTVKPLNPQHVEKALLHLQRKIQNFRCFLKEREGKLWVCEDLTQGIDFQYMERADSNDIIHQFSNEPLHSNQSPTWKARLMPVPDDTPCRLPEVKARYPYQYDFIIQNHHSFVDGVTMAVTTNTLVNLLNAIIAEKTIDDKPIGVYLSDEEIVNIDSKIAKNLMEDPERIESMKQEILACDSTPVILQAFPPPGGKPGTRHMHRHVGQNVLACFTDRCKANGVTFNSGMEALINTAIVQMVTETGMAQESLTLSINLSTDLRRYMKRRPEPILGFHVRPTVHRIETPLNVRESFWDYTRKLHKRLTHLITSGEALQQAVVRRLTLPQITPAEHFATNPKPVRDYVLSNLGDLTTSIPGVGEHLQQTDLSSFNGIHYGGFIVAHQMYTFRGTSPYTLSYDPSYMTENTAEMLIDRIVGLMKELGQQSRK